MSSLIPPNRKILAYLRNHSDDTRSCASPTSRAAVQPVALDLSRFKGMTPVEMLVLPSSPIGELRTS